ncbi:hypothetical protein Tco_1079244 [Tanacetum coccineum]|uniref:Histone deacetylase 14 n=1 Tax=Tanacetum coccineum TaxID=301880 RepID=A0ABQ5HRG9_9ASTR
MLWGFLSRTNVDYAELLREEFIQGIQVFFARRDSNKDPSKKPTPHVIPYCRFINMIIYFLGSKFNIHRRPESPRHVTGNDFLLGNLKFVPKGKKDGVFGMPIPKELITEAIQKSEYYKQYVEMAARKATVQVPIGGVAIHEPVSEATQQLLVVEGKGKAISNDEQAAQSLPSTQPEDDTSANIVCDTSSPTDAETVAETGNTNSEGDIEILNIGEEQGEDVTTKVDLQEKTTEIDEGQARSNPGKTPESRPPLEHVMRLCNYIPFILTFNLNTKNNVCFSYVFH